MLKPRTTLVALAAVLAGAALSGIGEAQADSSTTSATIVVNGTDTITLTGANPSQSDIQATYQSALGGALTNAGQHATFIAGQINATLGPITNVTETSSSSDMCEGPIMYASGAPVPATGANGSSKRKHHTAKAPLAVMRVAPVAASAGPVRASGAAIPVPVHTTAIIDPNSSCSVEADVTVTYAMTPASS
jgi:uncharacterized protein YggE